MDKLNQYLKEHEGRSPRPHITCADGTWLSVQASEYTYCDPRVNNAPEYFEVEVMVDENLVPSWGKWQDGEGSNIFGYVPVSVVNEFIEKHGGIKTP